MRTEIKMPKNITSMADYYDWVKSFDTETTELDVRMKRRTNFYPYDFRFEKDGKVEYLISDSVSYGCCKISNFNMVFKFEVVSYM